MPSSSAKQKRFMQMMASKKGRAKAKTKKKPPMKVAKEFVRADKGLLESY